MRRVPIVSVLFDRGECFWCRTHKIHIDFKLSFYDLGKDPTDLQVINFIVDLNGAFESFGDSGDVKFIDAHPQLIGIEYIDLTYAPSSVQQFPFSAFNWDNCPAIGARTIRFSNGRAHCPIAVANSGRACPVRRVG